MSVNDDKAQPTAHMYVTSALGAHPRRETVTVRLAKSCRMERCWKPRSSPDLLGTTRDAFTLTWPQEASFYHRAVMHAGYTIVRTS